jgi:hypothetical protein
MPSSPRPWETWHLDEDFFGALSRWTIDNPENSIDRILERISTAIDDRKDLVNIIPDSPFPARSLVQALGQLIKVGTACLSIDLCYGHANFRNLQAISKAKVDIQAFAKVIVHWVSQVASAFKNGNGGRFTLETWRHLEGIRYVQGRLHSFPS